MKRPTQSRQLGHSLVELLVVLAIMGICLALGAVPLARGIGQTEARGSAQTWQAAAAWAQTSAVWQGVDTRVSYESGEIAVASTGSAGEEDVQAFSAVPVSVNVPRWREGQGTAVQFLALSGHPDSAGSLFFKTGQGAYKVTVRLESGLTVRTRVEAAP
jgi:prepilin-type N-terminal cleavage/methylation domain-containing protein